MKIKSMKKDTKNTVNIDWLKQWPSSIALLDTNFCLVDASENWFNRFELSSENTQGASLFIIFPDLTEDWRTKLEYTLDGLKDIQILDHFKTADGIDKKVAWYLNPWKDGSGNILGVVLNVKEVNEASELQIELNHVKSLLNKKGKITNIGSWQYNVKTGEVVISTVFKSIFKGNLGVKIVIEDIIELYKKGDSQRIVRTAISNAVDYGTPWDLDLEVGVEKVSTWVNFYSKA